jgi:cystathionine beta-lyase family protein involved in aluminum resistance
MDNDSSSLDTILSELTNADPQIRKAALEATIQFASRDAIPKLAEVAAQTDDPQEEIALNDAIEFLKLPSLTEVIAANKTAQPAQPVKAFVKAAHPLPPAARAPSPTTQ